MVAGSQIQGQIKETSENLYNLTSICSYSWNNLVKIAY